MRFTPREQEILHLAADLHSRTEIQAILGCSKSTIDAHLNRIFDKAEVHSYIGLIRYALDNGHGCRYQALLTACPIETMIANRKAEKMDKPKLIVSRVRMQRHSKRLIVERKTI